MRCCAASSAEAKPPHVFKVAQEITKLSDDFKMSFGRETENFTPLKRAR
jgi:succinylglutamate desuccinylase